VSNKLSGINKRVSEPVYPADILSDSALRMCCIVTRGIWYECLLNMWRDKTHSITGTPKQLAVLFGCGDADVTLACRELCDTSASQVTYENGKVTLTCRRLERRGLGRVNGAKRTERWRNKRRSDGSVTPKKAAPSSSSSSIDTKETPPPALVGGDAGEKPRGPSEKTITAEFDRIWLLVPLKVGKPKARQAYLKHRKAGTVTEQAAADGIERYTQFVKRQRAAGFDDLPWRNGSTLFTRTCWADEFEVMHTDNDTDEVKKRKAAAKAEGERQRAIMDEANRKHRAALNDRNS